LFSFALFTLLLYKTVKYDTKHCPHGFHEFYSWNGDFGQVIRSFFLKTFVLWRVCSAHYRQGSKKIAAATLLRESQPQILSI
jgi:hypothetical protein